ncbi:hypothetical protein AB3S75_027209 [Citrus x aurantiifolia]
MLKVFYGNAQMVEAKVAHIH